MVTEPPSSTRYELTMLLLPTRWIPAAIFMQAPRPKVTARRHGRRSAPDVDCPGMAEQDVVEQEEGPEEDAFEAMVRRAIEQIPEPFASQLGSVAIVIDEVASPALLASVRARGLFGLYQGVPRTTYGADQVP